MAYLEESYTDAFVVLHNGHLVSEWYREQVEPDEKHIVFSVSKSVAGLLACALFEHGALDPASRVEEVIPEAADSGFAGARVQDVLDMTVGLAFTEDYTPGPDFAVYRTRTGFDRGGPIESSLREYLCTIGRRGPHGETFRYASPAADMLGWICERASGLPYADALSKWIWQPLGAEADAEIALDPFEAAISTGGLSMTARDMARIGLIVVQDGAGVVGEAVIKDLLSGGSKQAWARGEWADFLPGGEYHNFWYQTGDPSRAVLALGIFGQMIYANPTSSTVVACQCSQPMPEDDKLSLAALDTCRAIDAALAA